MFAIWRWGSEDQKNEWLPSMATGESIGCFGLTEPDHGSDPGSMKSTALRVDARNIVRRDLRARNGILHIVDGLLTPDVDASLDETRSKRAFWEAFKALGPWWSELPPY